MEQVVVEAMAETIIPTDSNGPGAKEAGAVYFIDRQLASDYGKNGNMYNRGPFVMAGMNGPITANNLAGQSVTYSGGSMITAPTAGTKYQYGVLFRDFWRYGVQALETYSNSVYGGNFEKLSAANQVAALTDLANNKPTGFNGIVPSDFFNEVFFTTWCGFLMDPLWGGNQGMVGWELTGFNGVNMGNFYGEGMTTKQLMVSTTPTRLKPASLAAAGHSLGQGGSYHQKGGTRMGASSGTSMLNMYQQSWTASNFFITGESASPFYDNITAGTHMIGPQAYLASEGNRKYLASPGELVTSM